MENVHSQIGGGGQWLRRYATSPKGERSRPDEVNLFFFFNLTPLVRRADHLTTISEPIVYTTLDP
jgi:hypothetical protein